MDTVTEAPLAIALAREGGIGVIHKNMSIAEQAAHVRRVKRAENGMIYDPITISKEHTVGDALALMQENKIGGIPVIDAERRLIGIVTNRDLRFQRDMHRLISEVMTSENLITTHSSELAHAADVLLNNKIEKLPVVDNEGKLVGLITYKDITKVQDHPNACKDSKGRLRVAAGVGVTGDSMERVDALVGEDVDAIVLDSAHGHSANIVALLRRIKAKYPELDVVVDIVKALAAGGDCVMIGSMFAGTEESPGDTIIYNGRKFKSYRGMGSIDAMKAGSADRYFQKGEVNINKLVPEGIVARVPFKGSLSETVYQLVGGIRAGMGYCGAADIETLKQARFIRITANGVTENHPHDVTITSEAPNYSSEH